MLDLSVSYNRFKFLGFEFLTWLWYLVDSDPVRLKTTDMIDLNVELGNRIVLENRMGDATETITIKGDDAGLEEGVLALKKGAVVTELNLIAKSDEKEWRFTLKGESLDIAGLKIPESPIETKADIEGAVIDKIFLMDTVVRWLDMTYQRFIRLRISENWKAEELPLIRKWMEG